MMTTRNTAAPAGPVGARPFTARSVIASTLLGAHPPVLPVRVLVRSGALFGISEGTVRVALTRMVSTGELTTDGDGRYELAGRLRRRQARQDESRTPPPDHAWDGRWELSVVRSEARPAAERAELRSAMQRLRCAELRPGTWTRPANLDPTRLPDDRAIADAAVHRFDAHPADATEVVAALWDLRRWAADAKALHGTLGSATRELRRRTTDAEPGALADAFTLNAEVRRHLQRDPLLPFALLASNWPGGDLRARFDAFDLLFLERWRTWLRA